MTRTGLLLGLIAVTSLPLSAQQPASAFEVASIKPNTRADRAFSEIGKGSVVTTSLPMRALINLAHGVRPDRIVGSPAWFDRERFDITARAPAGTPNSANKPSM
jgi:uncharacterized protein (TIGR03435 family)